MANPENEGLANTPPTASALGSRQALTTTEQLALALLDVGPHEIGPIQSEGEMAAALVFAGLAERGHVMAETVGYGRVRYSRLVRTEH